MAADDEALFAGALLTLLLSCPFTILSTVFISAPYGKHFRHGWGPTVPSPIAWFLMESPTLWLSLLLLPAGRHLSSPIALSIFSLYILHYIHRTLIYPLRLRRSAIPVPLSIAAMAFFFNVLNSYIQTRSATHYTDYSGRAWKAGAPTAARVAVGFGIFVWGMAVNVASDIALVRLKAEGGGYRIPRGGWFEKVSCPNYMGEIVEWIGWALMAWSPAACAFVAFTAANLVPRARSHHIWYRNKFGADYPNSRKAIVPYIF